MILFYRVFTNFLYPFLLILLFFRIFTKKEDARRYREKIFIDNFDVKKRNNCRLFWFHAASIGEFKSIIPILKEINEKEENIQFLITTNTLTSSRFAKSELERFNNALHRFLPFDVNFLIENFLNAWTPDRIFLVDSEIWPNLILKAKKKKIPIALINARITKKSFNRWVKFPRTARIIFSVFNLCLCANKETKDFLQILGAKNIIYEGNIKLINKIFIKELNHNNNKILTQARFWVAASVHKEEDILCLKTHMELRKHYNNIITIIAPRHIDRVSKINSLSKKFNFKTQILDKDENIIDDVEIIIINSFGVLQNYFRNAKSVFIGKSTIDSLKNDSGQNPIDAAYLNCKIYHGPYVSNFNEIYEILGKNGITQEINNYKELSNNLINDLRDPRKMENFYSNTIQSLGKDILNQTMKILKNFIDDKN